jgi:RNA polymerase sigma factor (sigma-70 family)
MSVKPLYPAQLLSTSSTQPSLSDEELVSAAQSGEHAAFCELWNRHSKKSLNLIYSITKNWQDAEDALQNTFLSAFTHLKDFNGQSSFSTWVYRIAVNSALSILRKRRANREFSVDSGGAEESQQAWEPMDRRMNTGHAYERWENVQCLRKAICQLPPELRSLIELRQLQEHRLKDIAVALGISVTAAKSRLFRAKRMLRKLLINENQSLSKCGKPPDQLSAIADG